MSQFDISPDGTVRETTVSQIVERLGQMFPQTEPLAAEANLMVARAYGALSGVVASYWAEFGLTGHRYNVLRLLLLADQKRLPMKEIAAGLNVGTTNVTSLIDGLERDGLVVRVGASEDKRVTYAQLTPEGEERLLAVYPHSSTRLRKAWAGLSNDEKRILIHLLAKLRMHMQEASLTTDVLEGIGSLMEPAAPGAGKSGAQRRRPVRAAQ